MNSYFDEKTHKYYLDGDEVPGVTTILYEAGLIEKAHYNEHARARGVAVAKAIELYLRNDLDHDSIHPEVRPYFDSFIGFCRVSRFVFEVSLIEKPLIHTILRFGGKPDLPAYTPDGLPCVIDIKTGAPASWHPLQTALYAILLRDVAKFGVIRRYCLYLCGKGLIEHTDPDDEKIALSALTLSHFKRRHGYGDMLK